MGDVYRATDTVLERTVAVKVLTDHYARQDDARARFRREALAAARLSAAPTVVTVFDVAEHDGCPLIVMEYLEGGSVHDRLRLGRIPHTQALTWLEQAADALDRAHASGIVHRDVKPANLLLDHEGNVHVSDFGIASATGADTLTAPGTILGTVGYLSPEQARGEPATPASDRYALAVVAFELLTGRRPFAGDTPTTEAFAHLHAAVPHATAVDPSLPSSVDRVFETALAKDAGARPGTARELVRRLREALDRAPEEVAAPTGIIAVPSSKPEPPTHRLVRRTHRSRRPRVVVAGVACVAALLLLLTGLGAALVAAGDGFRLEQVHSEREARRAQATTSVGETTTDSERTAQGETPAEFAPDGAALNADGFARMQAGDFVGAIPLLRGAVLALKGSNTLNEAYASYNLAYSRFAVGRCDGVEGLLLRSERIQGSRAEIEDLRRRWEGRCTSSEGSDEGGDGDRPGKAKGHGKQRDH